MKKKFTFLLAALVLLGGLVGPMGKAWGQTSGNYTLNFLTSQTDTPVTSPPAVFDVSGMKYMRVASGVNAATNLYLSSEGLKFGKDGQTSVLGLVTNSSYGKVKPTAISFTFAKPFNDVSFAFWVNNAIQVGTIPSDGVGDERIVRVPITDGSALSRLQIATAATSPQMFVLKKIKVEYKADITASPSDIQLDTPVGTTTTGTFTINYSGLVEGSTIDFVVPDDYAYRDYLTLQPSSFTPSNRTCGSTTVVATWAPQEPVQNASIQCSANCPASGIAGVTMGVTANAQSISPSPSSLSFSYAVGNATPEGKKVDVSCANLGEGNNVTVSLGQGSNSHFELWDVQSSQSGWINLTQFTATNTNQNSFDFSFLVRLKPGYEQGSTHNDVVNLTATVNGNTVSATVSLTGTVTAPTYAIQFEYEDVSHGYVSCSPQSPFEYLQRVTLTPHPLSGYQYSTCHFTDENGNHVDNLINYEPNGDGTYSFNMPDFNLVCHPSFVPTGAAATAAPTNVQVFDVTAHGYHFTFSPMSQEQTQWLTAITQTTETPTDHWGNTTNTWGGIDNHPNIYSNTRYYLWVSPKCGDWDNLEYHWSQPVEFTTTAECTVADTDFFCGADAHNAYLTFNNGRDWQVRWSFYNTMPETEPETVTGSYYSITGLDGDTDYHIWLRTECEQVWYGHKQWSEWRQIDIHTEAACPAPEALMAYGVTGTTATVWWFGAPYENPSWTVYLKARDRWGDWHSYTTNQNYFNFTSAQFDDEGGTNWEDWTWDVYVTCNCGGEDGESAPSKTITFTTNQYQDHTVNDGLETNTQVPIEGLNVNNYSMSQFIIPAKDLAAMRNSNVSSMTFYCQEASIDWGSNAQFDVYLWNMPCGREKDFSGENFFPWNDMEKVCEAKNLSITDYQMQVLFDETFLYTDGNLLVGIKQVSTGTRADCHWIGDYTNYNASLACYKEKNEDLYYFDLCKFLPKVKFAYESTHPISARPFHLEANPLDSRTVVFSWSPADDEMSWEVAFGKPGIFDPDNSATWLHSSRNMAHCQYRLSNHSSIQPEQEYEFVVRALGWDSSSGNQIPLSGWTCPVSFTMPATCEATNIQVADITSTDATISWEGAENANVRYREAQILSENFDRESVADLVSYSVGWKIINESDNTGNAIKLNANTYMGDEGKSFQFYSYNKNISPYSTSYDQYLITPKIAAAAKLSFYYKGPSDEYEEYFRVGYSTTQNYKENFTWGDVVTVNSTTWTEYTAIIPEGTKYVAIYYNPGGSRMYLYIDNFTIGNPNSTWSEQPAGMPFDICCLTPETTYEFQLQPKCGGSNNGDWTAVEYFTTTPIKRFVGQEGEEFSDWNVASNWSPAGVPTIYEDVIIEHKANILYGFVGEARNITTTGENYIYVHEGAQLRHSNSGVAASLRKVFQPYTGNNDHFYLIAPPTDEALNPANIWLLLNGTYDLYRFDQSSDLEWRNYRQTPFNLEAGNGYLYATGCDNAATVNFMGELNPSENDYTILQHKSANANLSGWNLVGNPFACNAVIGRPFYRIEETANGSEIVPATGSIAPLEGVFVQASTDGERLSFSRYGATSQNAAQPTIGINVMQSVTTRGNESTALVDKALVRFGEGQGLEKFQLNPKHTKLYVPMESKDYAVACSQAAQGEMPLNFKAEKDGTYTLSFDVENVEMDYLHLIDNMTGADVDLLHPNAVIAGEDPQSPAASYTFTAKTTDYASRFRLVFSGQADGPSAASQTFAYYNGSEWVVSNQGRATLQVVDVMGRVLSSEQIDGNAEVGINQPAGVYMLRLVSGDSVKVQKVVVR